MNATVHPTAVSDAARARFLAREGKPLLLGDWMRALFIHYEVDPVILQQQVPFALDLYEGKAWVSLVAFSMRRLRPRFGGKLAEWIFRPLANHEFLNVRTYVRHRGQPGIFFIAEWLNNFACTRLGPRSYGLPYRFGKIAYAHRRALGEISGKVRCHRSDAMLSYAGALQPAPDFSPCTPGSLDEFLLERYSAFTLRRHTARCFNIWHKPWPQVHSMLTSRTMVCWRKPGRGSPQHDSIAPIIRQGCKAFGSARREG